MSLSTHNPCLSNDNDGEEGSEGVQHAGVLLGGAAASEEAQDKEDDATDAKQDGTIGKTLVKELQELLHNKYKVTFE